MNIETESKFINSFVVKQKRDRVIWELNSPKRRRSCLWNIRRYLYTDCINVIKHISGERQLYEILRNEGFGETCYVITDNERESDNYSTKEAISMALESMTIIIYDEVNDLAFFDDEDYNKCLLRKRRTKA